MLNTHFNTLSSSTMNSQRQTLPTPGTAQESLRPAELAASSPGDATNFSREATEVESSADGVDNLLQGLQSWGEPEPSKASAGASKQAGSAFGKVESVWNSRAGRLGRGAAGAQQALNPENSVCQRVAGGFTAFGGAANLVLIPQVQAAARGSQAVGAAMTWGLCPLIDNFPGMSPADVRRRQERYETNSRLPVNHRAGR